MISATAGLEEGYIDAYTTTYCSGSFNTVTPSPKCWIYPGGHGSVECCSIIAAFLQRLLLSTGISIWESIPMGNYDSDLGTDKLRKYAANVWLRQEIRRRNTGSCTADI